MPTPTHGPLDATFVGLGSFSEELLVWDFGAIRQRGPGHSLTRTATQAGAGRTLGGTLAIAGVVTEIFSSLFVGIIESNVAGGS